MQKEFDLLPPEKASLAEKYQQEVFDLDAEISEQEECCNNIRLGIEEPDMASDMREFLVGMLESKVHKLCERRAESFRCLVELF